MIAFRILFTVLIVAAWFTTSTPTSARPDGGNIFSEQCRAADGIRQRAECYGYVSGIVDLEQAPLVIDGQRFCMIDGVVPHRLVDVAVKWWKASPNLWFGKPTYAVFLKSIGAFPC